MERGMKNTKLNKEIVPVFRLILLVLLTLLSVPLPSQAQEKRHSG